MHGSTLCDAVLTVLLQSPFKQSWTYFGSIHEKTTIHNCEVFVVQELIAVTSSIQLSQPYDA